ncbi:hypothetical protein LTR10_008703 [Elasticomyces elasticus]|nr:hypothetical protein LTR10_008703 [Elasticomyces elasticus]KAK4974323.1 hypothetical protein LTR42_004965 [Elasticomyces elasticus]
MTSTNQNLDTVPLLHPPPSPSPPTNDITIPIESWLATSLPLRNLVLVLGLDVLMGAYIGIVFPVFLFLTFLGDPASPSPQQRFVRAWKLES